MEALQPEWFTEKPYVARSQIKVLPANESDIFVAIPNVTVRNHFWLDDFGRGRHGAGPGSHINWRRRGDDYRGDPDPAIRFNDTA